MYQNYYIQKLAMMGILVSLIPCYFAYAEDPHPSVQKLTIEELVSQALTQNPDLLAAEADVAAARGERRAAGQWKNPVANVEYGEKRNADRTSGNLIAKGNAQSYSIGQTFEFPGKATLRKAIADQSIGLAELALEELRLEIAARTRSLAIVWFTAHHESVAAEEVAERSETLATVLRKRAPAGIQSLLDRRIIEADQIRILARSHEVEEKREAAQVALNILCGRQPDLPIEIHSDLELPKIDISLKALLEKAMVSSLALKSGEIDIEQTIRRLDQARLDAAPDLTIGPFYHEETATERERSFGIGFSFPLPLWDSNRGQVDSAQAVLARARATSAQRFREIQRELTTQFEAYQHIRRLLEKTPLSVLSEMRDAAELADRQYRLGAIPVQTYVDMQDKYLEAAERLLSLIHEAHQHHLKIQLLTSDPLLIKKKTTAGGQP